MLGNDEGNKWHRWLMILIIVLSFLYLAAIPFGKIKERLGIGSGLITLGIEKRKAKCGKWRLSWLVTNSIMLRLPCAALIAEDKHATSFITAPTRRATGRVCCGSVVFAGGAYRSAEAQLSST
jgi:hypothetical protein